MKLALRSGIFFFIAIQLCFGLSVHADTPTKVDSLKNRLAEVYGIEKLQVYVALIANLRNIDPVISVKYGKEALLLADSLDHKPLKAKILNEQGVCYKKLNITEKALQLHLESLHLFENMNDSIGIAYTLANIGNVYHQYGELEKALDYHFRALFLKEYLNDEPQIAYSQNAIGMILSEMEENTRALDFFISAMAIFKKHNKVLELANVYSNIGKVMIRTDRIEEAKSYFNKAYEVYVATKTEYGEALVLNNLAELDFKNNAFEEAIKKLDRSGEIARALNNLEILHFNYKLRKEIYKRQNKFKEAVVLAEKAAELKDSLVSERRNYEIEELQVKYETQKIDSENVILKLKIKEQSYKLQYTIAGAFILILFLVAFFILRLFLRKKKAADMLTELNQSLEQRVEERTKELNQLIKEKQIAYNSLKQSEERLNVINDTSPYGIAVTNAEGKIVFLNQRLTETTGLIGNDFTDSSWIGYILHEDRKNVESYWQNAHKYQGNLPELKFRLRNANNFRWIKMKGAPMRDDNNFVGLVVVFENITESEKFEHDLIIAKNKAEESDLLKSAFLANMSHEIRTPMNAILGFSDLLSSDEYSSEEKIEFVDMIRSSGKILLNLINDIIDISKIEAGELKIQHTTFKVVNVLDEQYQNFRQQLNHNGKKNVRLIFSGRNEILNSEITTDKHRLTQILTNLLSNASKFTLKGQIEFGMIQVGKEYEFFVKDTGIGIPEAKLEIIFQRFRQADDSHTRIYGGTGLGLAITKNLTQLLGGNIWVESVENKGTAFYFTLPANELGSQHEGFYPDFSSKTILIAEDVGANFTLLNGMLRYTNVNVLHADNGLITVDMALEAQPDLILMDIQMPELDGIKAFQQLKKRQFKKPIVAISAFAQSEDEERFLRLGFDSYLSKPLSIEKVMAVLRLFLEDKTQQKK